ncbi:hypothetical protein PVAP13_4NG203300 [Panicum virgatum]|uniref:Uncharacterized protein n=1 Tax=Panicum virgatum TaxID=38727 RepID=A0A8T0TAV3_PANVG|nr:hypothetical protein PVAP13_4NG203300 [Panicum virgatum]
MHVVVELFREPESRTDNWNSHSSSAGNLDILYVVSKSSIAIADLLHVSRFLDATARNRGPCTKTFRQNSKKMNWDSEMLISQCVHEPFQG